MTDQGMHEVFRVLLGHMVPGVDAEPVEVVRPGTPDRERIPVQFLEVVAERPCTSAADPPTPDESTDATPKPAPVSPSEAAKPEQGVFCSYPFEPDDTFELGTWNLLSR
ncbi:hypothetical protein [Promicromonospora sp. NPDC050262]|uniref:hypothetical protein n=1 Tax=Promicromonospora sp. NPDC050262 TaxID=3155036 RepID=UPI0033C23EF7